MILRKPFAFLIKHFRLIHFIMLIFMAYVMYSCNAILSFFSEYLNSTMVLIDHEVVLTLYPIMLFVSIIFILLINIVILVLMLFKKKPIKFYIFNILITIFTFVVLIISKNTLNNLELNLVEVRILKLIQDIVSISVILQSIPNVVVAIRATGFNIKKFDFAKDLEELDIETKDNEEFEVNLELETDKYQRKFRRFIRYIKYIYIENRYLFTILLSVLFAGICFGIYLNQSIYNKIYSENETLTTSNFYFNVGETYLTKTDYKGNVIDPNYSFLIVKANIRSFSSIGSVFSIGRIALNINDNNIYHTTDYKTEFSDLGIYYNDELIYNSFSTHLLVYKIPNSYVDDKMMIKYFDNNHKTIRIKISPKKIDEDVNETTHVFNEKTSFNNSILKKSNLTIENSELNKEFNVSYNYCVNTNECLLSTEIIKPILNTNYDKALIKIKGLLEIDNSLSIVKPSKLFEFIEKYGTITYKIGEQQYNISSLTQVIPNKINNSNTIYLEVPSNIMDANEIKLKIRIRNNVYVYNLTQ